MTLADPTGLFSGLEAVLVLVLVLEACAACVPALSSLSFLAERHSLAQWPNLPQLWHLPLRRRRFPSSEAVADRASSVVESFFPPCPFGRRFFNRSASSQIWLMRASRSTDLAPWTIRAEDMRCDANVASSPGIPRRIVRSYSFSVTRTPAAANSSRLQPKLARNSLTSPPFAHRISKNA